MALMFSRLANNFIKNGYFPTDETSLTRIQNFLLPPKSRAARLLDPCCGEGSALADLRQGLDQRVQEAHQNMQAGGIEALGIEFDRERAWHAKSILDRVIHADLHDVVVKPRSIGLLFLNPPYGFGVADSANRTGAEFHQDKAERLERTFLKKTAPLLALGGVLVFIIPFYALDEDMRIYLARNFTRVQFFMAPEKQFKQCVIFGIKTRSGHPAKDVLHMLARGQAGELNDQVLPETWEGEPYVVAPITDSSEFTFHAVRMDAEQLQDELRKYRQSLLWQGFETFFNQVKGNHKRPLRDMTQWHLALALAAGQVTGKITSKTGRTFLIKGNTFKRKDRSVETVVDEDGNISETIVMLDKFVPVINAIEFTPGDRLGQVVKIS